jgi:hypothetical protein
MESELKMGKKFSLVSQRLKLALNVSLTRRVVGACNKDVSVSAKSTDEVKALNHKHAVVKLGDLMLHRHQKSGLSPHAD